MNKLAEPNTITKPCTISTTPCCSEGISNPPQGFPGFKEMRHMGKRMSGEEGNGTLAPMVFGLGDVTHSGQSKKLLFISRFFFTDGINLLFGSFTLPLPTQNIVGVI